MGGPPSGVNVDVSPVTHPDLHRKLRHAQQACWEREEQAAAAEPVTENKFDGVLKNWSLSGAIPPGGALRAHIKEVCKREC